MVAALLSELGGAFETNGNIEEAERMYTTAVALVRGHRARCGLSTVLSVADPYVVMIRIAYYSVVPREHHTPDHICSCSPKQTSKPTEARASSRQPRAEC